ncbi:sensor histidine kinase [Aquimarina sp. RZ0]|uniref:sensor histidine kinase n=1 Tax=Aquimarina sp. RZ0 TaxID=2607730 RepID=UPI0011F40301|nr:histidine kinase [Aquimarina sp. RZ0]KAA1247873.1 hypothetical protein F0000_01255 [Aquimarina sp. RZ0]
MVKIATIKKFGIRILIINVAYTLIKFTIIHDENHDFYSPTNIFYYTSAFFLFMLAWETNDWLVRRLSKTDKSLDLTTGTRILLINILLVIPITALIYYLAIFEFNHICKINADTPWLRFRIDFLRATLIGFTVIIFNLFYYSLKQKKDIENKMIALQKEVMTSKYKSLKNQISPHFLFNSLNTLTSLMYEDRDLASDFVSRLASCYRYILDNREEDLVSLEKELNFMDSFIFMMNIRHEGALSITSQIFIHPKDYNIPTLSLQMLVENALKHNYFSKEKPLKISIISLNDTSLLIENNLYMRKETENSTKLGLKNIKKRYSFYTNQNVLVESSNSFFKVTIPLLPKNIKEIAITKVPLI